MFARILSLALVAALVSPLAAADKSAADKNLKNVKAGKKGGLAGLALPKGVELSAEQQAKLKPIQDEAAAKLAELQIQIDAILTPERKAAQAEAMKKAQAEGKDKKEASQAAQAALALKADESAKLKQLGQESGAILKDAREKLNAILTEEQKAKLSELKKGKGTDKNKKPGKGETPVKGSAPDKREK
jgi:Spy/CpxP family protein refolding chaperone